MGGRISLEIQTKMEQTSGCCAAGVSSDMTDSLLISSAISMISIRSSGGSFSNGNGGLVVKTRFPILKETLVLVPWTAFVMPKATGRGNAHKLRGR